MSPTVFGAGGRYGGGERYPLELARALAPHVDCELVTFGPEPGVAREPCGLLVRVLRPWGRWRGDPVHPIAPGLPAALAGADIVHVHHMRAAPSRLAALAGRLSGRRLAVTDHGLGGGGWCGALPRMFDRFLVVSRFSAATLDAPPGRTHVLYGGADVSRFFPGRDDERAGALFVGRLTPHKGVDRLIQALPEDVDLTVAGTAGHDTGPPESGYPDLLRRLARGRRVRFAGAVADEEMPELYRRAAVAVLPSVERTCYGRRVPISELLGLTVLEAMASGTPVICSRVGGVPEIVRDGDTGLLTEPGDLARLGGLLTAVLGDPVLARRLGTAGRRAVLDRFTWERCAHRCLAAYEAMLAE